MKRTYTVLKALCIVLALAVVACLIAIGLLTHAFDFLRKKPETPAVTPPEPDSAVNRFLPRKANEGRVCFGGEADERFVDGFFFNDRYYLVGDSDSRTLDLSSGLKGRNLFVAVLDQELTVTAVAPFGTDGDDDAIGAAMSSEGLMILSSSDDTPALYRFDYAALTAQKIPLPVPSAARPKACLRVHDAVYCVFETDETLSVARYDRGKATLVAEVDSPLRFVALYPTANGIRLFANEGAGSDATLKIVTIESEIVCKSFETDGAAQSVAPTETGYAVLTSGAQTRIRLIGYTLETIASVTLPSAPTRPRLVAATGGLLVGDVGGTVLYTVVGSSAVETAHRGSVLLDIRFDGRILTHERGTVYDDGVESGTFFPLSGGRYVGESLCVLETVGIMGKTDLVAIAL